MSGTELFSCPADLTLTSDADLTTLHTAAVAEFTRVHASDDPTPELLTYAGTLADSLDRIKAEESARALRAKLTTDAARDQAAQSMAQLAVRVNGEPEPVADAAPQATAREIATEVATAVTAALVSNLTPRGNRIASLAATREAAPDQQVPVRAAMLRVTSSVDVPSHSLTAGAVVPSMEAMAEAFRERAGNVPITSLGQGAPRYPVAQVHNEFTHTVDSRTNPHKVMDLYRELTSPDKADALVAGGGWCAPSQIRYDLFNIADAPVGMIDLPTIGIDRGGLQYPTSPAIGDVFFTNAGSNPASGMGGFAFPFSNASDPWLWTETDDINTVTGSVNKPTLRVPCASFNNVRLEAYGITLTAGNLTDSAYPEATQNFLRLLRAAWAHAINARLIGLMVTASGGANTIGATNTDSPAPRIFNAVGMAATDYRARYAMRNDSVLEVVLPYWIKEIIRADLAWKIGIDSPELFSVVDPTINEFFASRNVRVQWVDDWQVRGASQFGGSSVLLVWPTTVNFMIYAAGTFLHGTGLKLDLGIVRDSVLNAENDFTAAWAEEAHLIAMVGHASRLYTCGFNVSGGSGVTGTVKV